jgi:hypothetical protein
MWQRIDRELDRDACGLERLHEQQADRPAAEDGSRRPRFRSTEIDRVQRDAERLEQRGGLVGDGVRQRIRKPLRPRDERAKPAVGRAVTCEPQLAAEVPIARRAECAAAAGNRRVEHDALPGTRTARDDAGELVAEDEWLTENRIADAALEEPVSIGTAQTDTADAHEHLACVRFWVRLLVQSEIARRVQAQRLHVGWP